MSKTEINYLDTTVFNVDNKPQPKLHANQSTNPTKKSIAY